MKSYSSIIHAAGKLAALAAVIVVAGTGSTAFAQTSSLWVDAARGNDLNPGTIARPLQTLCRAIALAHAIPGGAVSIKLKPGTYPVAPNTTITRDHLSIEGLSNPVLDANGLLDH